MWCQIVCSGSSDRDDEKVNIIVHGHEPTLSEMLAVASQDEELLAYAKQHLPGCKVILITGNSKREYLSQALLLGAYDYVEKPFKNGELVELVSTALGEETNSPLLHDRAAAAMEIRARALIWRATLICRAAPTNGSSGG